MLVAVTVLPLPTLALLKVFGPPAEQLTLAGLPLSVQAVMVAAVVPSYSLFAAVTLAVSEAAVMLAVVVAVVDESW
jgi:hypothetical protein